MTSIGIKRSKGTEGLLKVAVILCLLYAALRAGQAIGAHIPPYSEGQCLGLDIRDDIRLRIKENHILGAYSDVELKVSIFAKEGPMSFQELNEMPFRKVDCGE